MGKMRQPLLLIFSCYLISSLLSKIEASEDVIGCGGFVKSEVDINYSVVEVKLYTKQGDKPGALKYQTDCAPNNGYYLIPIYDKGEYILQVEPPTGWAFNPQSVELNIDGTDRCSRGEDINFEFTGFGIVGRVVSHLDKNGPRDILLQLYKEGTPLDGSVAPHKETRSVALGDYTFYNVLPGNYVIKASHPKWTFSVDESAVTVNSETGNAGNKLSVLGYDTRGRVVSEGEPIKGVSFVLFVESANIQSKHIQGCDKSKLAGFPTTVDNKTPVCHVKSSQDGSFVFPSLPHGHYFIVPFYQSEHITFDVAPTRIKFYVGHSSKVIEEVFEVTGFSVSGRVLDKAKGKGLFNAKVLVNGHQHTTTKSDGSYHLESMKSGSYVLEVVAESIFFDPLTVTITPTTPHLPDIVAARFGVCGHIHIHEFPDGISNAPTEREVKVTSLVSGKPHTSRVVTTDLDGAFCTQLAPGEYTVEAVLSALEVSAGLRLAPAHIPVTVTHEPINHLRFHQFRATISGSLTCLEDCGDIVINLVSSGKSPERQSTQAVSSKKGWTFSFKDIMPGKYKVNIVKEEWCWKDKSLSLEVIDKDVTSLTFSQTGYLLTCSLSHDITLGFAHSTQASQVGSFDLTKGVNKFCLAHPGHYKLTPKSCHQFEQKEYSYDTDTSEMLTLTAVKHQVQGSITTAENVTDIALTVVPTSTPDEPIVLTSLTAAKSEKTDKSKPASFTYKFEYWATAGDLHTLTPASGTLLFYPASNQYTATGEGCPVDVVQFEGRRGVFIEGTVKPKLAGVDISISQSADSQTAEPIKPITTVTDETGKYRVGPLHSGIEYSVAAEKEGYVLTIDSKTNRDFVAKKLAEIIVKVTDDSGAVLPGVLLSLSGGAQYRSNKVTSDDGSINFLSLSPGEYFLRPMMKEYAFTPVSQMIDVKEGTTVNVDIKGVRTAFSCFGSVTSLNGEPESGVYVEAVGEGEACAGHQEESKTETDGSYRIRGLKPDCQYDIRLKSGDVNQHIERSAPRSTKVEVTGDIHKQHIIAFRRMSQLDLSGNVITDHEHISTLKVHVYKESSVDSAIYTQALGPTTFFYLPSLTIDGQRYIIRLESTLSRSQYEYQLPEFTFTADVSYKHFTFQFNPVRKQVDHELNHSSFMAFPLAILVIVAAYNYQKLLGFLNQTMSRSLLRTARPASQSHQHYTSHTAAVSDWTPEILGDTPPKKRRSRRT